MKGYKRAALYFPLLLLFIYLSAKGGLPQSFKNLFVDLETRKASHSYFLKIPWIVDNSFCEVIDENSNVLYTFPWSFCLITPEGFLGAVKGRLTFLNNSGVESWVRPLNMHHDLFYDPDLKIFTIPINSFEDYRGSKLKTDDIVQLDLSGKSVFRWSANQNLKELADSFSRAFKVYFVESKKFYEFTYINGASTIPESPLAIKNKIFRAGNILVSLNKIGLFILDPVNSKIVWTFRYDHLGSGQIHAARFQKDGTILFFLNRSTRYGYSQVVKIRPDTKEVVWAYSSNSPMEFYSEICGSVQSTDFGTILVTHMSRGGRAFELNQEGKVIWSWVNNRRQGAAEPLPIYRLERLEGKIFERMVFARHFSATEGRQDF